MSPLALGMMVAVMVFGLSRRLKRTFGRQALTRRHLLPRLIILPLVSVAVLLSWPTPQALLAAAAGLALGIALGVWGLALTRFESVPEGEFYHPNPWLGLVVTALFLGRMAMRVLVISQANAEANGFSVGSVPRSAWTTGLIFLVAGQAVSFSALLLREESRRRQRKVTGS